MNERRVAESSKLRGRVHGSYDVLKVILAYTVLIRHFTQAFLPIETGYSALICNSLSTPAVSTYFIISGYLFFSKPFSEYRLKHQLLRLIKLYLAWTVVYLPINVHRNIMDNAGILDSIKTFILKFIFSGSYYHLWYLPALMFALPFVSLMRKMKMWHAAVLSVALYITGLLGDSYRFLVPQFSDVFEIYSILFLTTRNGLFFGTIYVFIGYVLSQCDFRIKRSWTVIGIAAGLLLLCAEGIFLFEFKGITVANMTIFSLPVSVSIFLFALQQEVNVSEEKLLYLRKLSTELFCVHPILIEGVSFVNRHIITVPVDCIFALVILGSTFLSAIIVKLSGNHKSILYFV